MNKKLLAVAVVGALASPAAFAQTLYGIVDVGYQNVDHAPGDINKDFITTGQHSSSRLGVRGSEDLAGGTYAMYQIEFDIQADTGGTPASGMTHRLTFVGLGSKAWGELTLGRQLTHTFHTQVLGMSAGTGTFASAYGLTEHWTRSSNSIKYSSPVMGGFSVGAMWAPSLADGAGEAEATADTEDENFWDVAVRYAPGPFAVAASYGREKAEAGGVESEDTISQISANWDNRAFGIYGNYTMDEVEAGGVKLADIQTWSISGIARFGGNNEVHVMYGQSEDDEDDTNESDFWGVAFVHRMSKRTLVYAGYGQVDNEDGSAKRLNVQAAPATAGHKVKGFQVGLAHSF